MEPVDLICGGFPCQDLSLAGKRAGLGGKRSGLFYELVRVISGIRPQYFLLENVPGLFSSGKGWDFAAVIRALEDSGYGVAWRVLDSQYFGLAQRRKRVFIVGYSGAACPPEILFESDCGGGRDPQGEEARNQIAAPIMARSAKGINTTCDNNVVASAVTCQDRNAGRAETNYAIRTLGSHHVRNAPDDPLVCGTLSAEGFDGGEDGSRGRLVAGTLASNGFCGSPFSGGSEPGGYIPAPFDPDGMREGSRLPGRMDGTRRPTPDSPRYRALGNAVSVPVAEWIGRRIMEVNAKQEKPS